MAQAKFFCRGAVRCCAVRCCAALYCTVLAILGWDPQQPGAGAGARGEGSRGEGTDRHSQRVRFGSRRSFAFQSSALELLQTQTRNKARHGSVAVSLAVAVAWTRLVPFPSRLLHHFTRLEINLQSKAQYSAVQCSASHRASHAMPRSQHAPIPSPTTPTHLRPAYSFSPSDHTHPPAQAGAVESSLPPQAFGTEQGGLAQLVERSLSMYTVLNAKGRVFDSCSLHSFLPLRALLFWSYCY